MSFTESIAAARAFAGAASRAPSRTGSCVATGARQCSSAACSAPCPPAGGTSQTAVNRRAGARTQVAGLVTAAAAVATLSCSRR